MSEQKGCIEFCVMLLPQLDQTAQNKICILLDWLPQLLLIPNRHQYIDIYSIGIQHHKKKEKDIRLWTRKKHSIGIREDFLTLIKRNKFSNPQCSVWLLLAIEFKHIVNYSLMNIKHLTHWVFLNIPESLHGNDQGACILNRLNVVQYLFRF